MDKKDIIQQGEDGVYTVSIERDGFSMDEDDFSVELSYGMKGESVVIRKEDMTVKDGKYYFSVDTSEMMQVVTATCRYGVSDDACPDGVRQEVNRQYLCAVVGMPFPLRVCVPAYDPETEAVVKYERESYDETYYEALLTKDGEKVVTKDGMYVYVLRR